jgi:hypothetical protein
MKFDDAINMHPDQRPAAATAHKVGSGLRASLFSVFSLFFGLAFKISKNWMVPKVRS